MGRNENRQFEPTSKTKRKHEALELQKLGEKLTAYTASQLQQILLPENLIVAITEYNRLPNSHGARKRQLQYIGRLMRGCDYELVSNAMRQRQTGDDKSNQQHTAVISWCDKILQIGDSEINAVLLAHPQLERQKLRQLHRDYHRADESSRTKFRNNLQRYLLKLLTN